MSELSVPEFPDRAANVASRKRVAVLGGALAAAALAAGGYLLLGSAGEDAGMAALPLATPATRTTGPATPTPTPAPAVVAAAAQGRNPYKALYTAPAAAAASPDPLTGTAPASAVPVATTAAGIPSPSAGTSTAPSGTYPIKLVKIVGPGELGGYAENWLVDGTAVTTLAGQRFGRTGELVVLGLTKLNGSSTLNGVVLQVGTDDPRTVKVGATVQVS